MQKQAVMELDELKQMWKQTPVKNLNTDIMELIRHKSYGPLAALKRAFRKQMLLMILIPAMLFVTNSDDVHKVLTSIFFWSYVVFCAGVISFAFYNYRIVSTMEVMDSMVKINLEQKIKLLEKRGRLEIIGLRAAMIFFIALTEIMPYFQHYRMLDKWHSLPVAIRILVYAGLLLLQYFVSKKIKQRKVGRHLAYLKELVKEMK